MKAFLLLIVSSLSGCAALFAPLDEKGPDLSKVRPGVTRSVVEAELGQPVSDFRALPYSGAARKVLYRFVMRETPSENLGAYDSLVNKMIGIEGRQLYVYYDSSQRVVRSEDAPLKKERNR